MPGESSEGPMCANGGALPVKLRLIRGLQERKATKNITEAPEKASRWLWIKRGYPWCSMVLEHKKGTDHPLLGRPGKGV